MNNPSTIRLLWNDVSIYTLSHFFAGALTILAALYIHPLISIIPFSCFMIYELNEDWYLKDHAYKDILEYCIGVYLTIILIILGVI